MQCVAWYYIVKQSPGIIMNLTVIPLFDLKNNNTVFSKVTWFSAYHTKIIKAKVYVYLSKCVCKFVTSSHCNYLPETWNLDSV